MRMIRMIFRFSPSLILLIQGMMMIQAMMTSASSSSSSPSQSSLSSLNGLKGDLTYYKGNNWNPVVVVGDQNDGRMGKWIKRRLNVDADDDDDDAQYDGGKNFQHLATVDFRRLTNANKNRLEADAEEEAPPPPTTTTTTTATTSTLPLLNDQPALIKFSAIYLMNPIKDEIDFIGETRRAPNELNNDENDEAVEEEEEEEEEDNDDVGNDDADDDNGNEIADKEVENVEGKLETNNRSNNKIDMKRNRKNRIAGWEKRRSAVWNKFRGAWGKREPQWNNLKGMWGKRRIDGNWKKLQSAWGKRTSATITTTTTTAADDNDKKTMMLTK